MTRGVYQLKNLKDGYVYIGSSNHIEARVYDHFEELRGRVHYNKRLQRAFNDAERYFIWGVIKSFDDTASRDEIYAFEQEVMDYTLKKYNILLNATDHLLDDLSKRERTRQLRLKL